MGLSLAVQGCAGGASRGGESVPPDPPTPSSVTTSKEPSRTPAGRNLVITEVDGDVRVRRSEAYFDPWPQSLAGLEKAGSVGIFTVRKITQLPAQGPADEPLKPEVVTLHLEMFLGGRPLATGRDVDVAMQAEDARGWKVTTGDRPYAQPGDRLVLAVLDGDDVGSPGTMGVVADAVYHLADSPGRSRPDATRAEPGPLDEQLAGKTAEELIRTFSS